MPAAIRVLRLAAFGLRPTLVVVAMLNLAAGVAALLAGRSVQKEGLEPRLVTGSDGEERFTPREVNLCAACIGLSGFAAMVDEVAWTRLLALAIGSSTHAFALMLATFIAGLAMGAWVVARGKRFPNSLDALAWAELALAASLLLSMCFYGYLPYSFAQLSRLLSRQPGSKWSVSTRGNQTE